LSWAKAEGRQSTRDMIGITRISLFFIFYSFVAV